MAYRSIARQLLAVLHKGKLQGKGPFHSCPRAGKGNQESALFLLTFISITQKQAGAHTRLEPPQSYQGLLFVNADNLLCRSRKIAGSMMSCKAAWLCNKLFHYLGLAASLSSPLCPPESCLLPFLPSLHFTAHNDHEWCERSLSHD